MNKVTTGLGRFFGKCCEVSPFVISAALVAQLGNEWELRLARLYKELPGPSMIFEDYLNHPFTPFAVVTLIWVLPVSYRVRVSLWGSYFFGIMFCMLLPFCTLGVIVDPPERPRDSLVWGIAVLALIILALRLWKWSRSRRAAG